MMQTRIEKELEEAHKAGSEVIVFDHPKMGRSEYVMGLRMVSDSMDCMNATGYQLEQFMPSEGKIVGMASLAVMWWLSLRRSGHPDIGYQEIKDMLDAPGGCDWIDEGVTRVSPDDEDAPEEITNPTYSPPKSADTGQSP